MFTSVMMVAIGCADKPEGPECTSALLDKKSAKPMQWIGLTAEGIDTNDVEVIKAQAFVDGHEAFPVPLLSDEDGALSIFVPPHPAGLKGGKMRLRFDIGNSSCPSVDFHVDPIAPAPGTLVKLVEKYSQVIEGEAKNFGFSRQELIDVIDLKKDYIQPDIPVNILALATAQLMLEHPSNPNSLADIADGTAPMLANDDYDFSLFEALAAESGTLETLDDYITMLQQQPNIDYDWVPAINDENDAIKAGQRQSKLESDSGLLKLKITDAPELSNLMIQGAVGCAMLKNKTVDNLNAAVALAGMIPSFHTKWAAIVGGLFMLEATEIMRAKCGLFPSKLVGFEPNISHVSINEDSTTYGFDPIIVDATSDGWNIATTATQLAAYMTSVAFSFLPVDKALKSLDAGIFFEKFGEFIANYIFEISLWAGKDIAELFNQKYGKKIGPYRWKDIELDTSEWVAIASNITEQLDGKLAVSPTAVGQGSIVFRALKFPPGYYEARVPGQVHAINIDMPLRILVVPGDVVEIAATIEHADDKTLIWSNSTDSYGPVNEGNRNKTETSPAHVDFRTPSDASKYPIMITAKSQANKGLRAPEHHPVERSGHTFLIAAGILVSPSWACVPSGQSQTFSVETAYKDAQVRWLPEQYFSSAQGSKATFTAPNENGTYQITAETDYYANDGSIHTAKDTATVEVGVCKCWASVRIGNNPTMHIVDSGSIGPMPGAFKASFLRYGDLYFGPPGSVGNFDGDDADASMLTAGATYESSAFLFMENAEFVLDSYAGILDEPCIGCTKITSFDGRYVEGTSSGLVTNLMEAIANDGPDYLPYHAEFRLPYQDPNAATGMGFIQQLLACQDVEGLDELDGL